MEELSELFKIVAEENKKKKLEIESLVGDSFETLFIEQLKPKKKKIIQKKIQEPQIVEVVEVKKDTLIEKSLGLLSEPSDTKHKNDPLTPLNQKFATLDDLQKHYSTFLSRIQQQLSTLGGGGETQIRYLDDVVGVATNSSAYNSKFLQWDSSSNTAEFVNINSGNIVGIVTGYYGSFYDTTTQNAVGVNTYQPVTINTTDISNQVSIANSSHIVVANSGIYNIQFSLQIDKSQGSLAHVYIWLKKNGVDVPNSATELAVQGTNSEVVAAWNFVVSASANDYYELMWSSTDDHIQIKARTASGVVPAIPSIILTVVSV
jgi:hypothetical protein